jgi:hypothetical protein
MSLRSPCDDPAPPGPAIGVRKKSPTAHGKFRPLDHGSRDAREGRLARLGFTADEQCRARRPVAAATLRGVTGKPSRVRPEWVREVGRDVMALGGVVFYALVLGRALVGPFWDLAIPLAVLGAAFALALPLLRGVDLYLTRALLVAVMVSRHYHDPVFATFAAVAFVAMVVFAIRLGRPVPAVVRGVALGAVASGVAVLMATAID